MAASDFAAHPSEQELVASFLRPRVVSLDDDARPCAFIHEADVYAADPTDLTCAFAPAVSSSGEEVWYFFSAVRAMKGGRKERTVDSGEGCWHSEAGAKPVVAGGGRGGRRRLGHRQSFSFVRKEGGQRVRSGWLMVELGLDDGQDQQVVLCKVYFGPRAPGAKKPAATTTSCGSKRKLLPADASAPARQRRRAYASPVEEDDRAKNMNSMGADEPADAFPQGDDQRNFFSWWRNKHTFLKLYFGEDDGAAGGEHAPAALEGVPDADAGSPMTGPLQLPVALPPCFYDETLPVPPPLVDDVARAKNYLANVSILDLFDMHMPE